MNYKQNVKINQIKESTLIGRIEIGSTIQYWFKMRLFHRMVWKETAAWRLWIQKGTVRLRHEGDRKVFQEDTWKRAATYHQRYRRIWNKKPVIKASICNSEKVARFKDIHTGKIEEGMLIKNQADNWCVQENVWNIRQNRKGILNNIFD